MEENMSRLAQLLTERNTTEAAVLTGDQFRKYSETGNLFRLMMVTNPDQPIPQTKATGLVAKMLSDLDTKVVKKLQTSFNVINKALHTGKNPSVASKKTFFNLLFQLLLPMTGEDNLIKKTKSIATSFAGGGEKTLVTKRKTIVMIGRSLLKNIELKLNGLDKALIKGFIMGFEAITNQDKDDKGNTEPVPEQTSKRTDVIEQKVLDQSTAKIKQTIDKTESIVVGVRAKQPNTSADIKSMLDSNKTADIFKVKLTGDNESLNEKVNYFIDNMYSDLVERYGEKDANFATKYVTDVLKNLDSAKLERTVVGGRQARLNVLRLYWNKMDINVTKSGGNMKIDITNNVGEANSSNPEVLKIEKEIKNIDGGGEMVAKVHLLQIPDSAQGSGINKRLFKSDLALFEARGVDKINLKANIDVGGYAWFRYGFVPKDVKEVEGISKWINNLTPSFVMGLQYDVEDIAKHITKNTKTMTPATQNFIDLVSQGKSPQAEKVVGELLSGCSIEFMMDYDKKSEFGKMSADIAVKNCNPVDVDGVKYSISYKALFSINSIKDNANDAIIPMKYLGEDNHLDWAGELDMKDLDKTYAYLGFQK